MCFFANVAAISSSSAPNTSEATGELAPKTPTVGAFSKLFK